MVQIILEANVKLVGLVISEKTVQDLVKIPKTKKHTDTTAINIKNKINKYINLLELLICFSPVGFRDSLGYIVIPG
jgi:hypothetical protein